MQESVCTVAHSDIAQVTVEANDLSKTASDCYACGLG